MKKVSRRQFLKMGAATLMVLPVAVSAMRSGKPNTLNSETTYGHKKAADDPRWKAFLNDEDISGRCTEADDRKGWVKLLPVNMNGEITSLVDRVVYGKVRLIPWNR